MIINFSNIGTGGGSGSGYTLPIATETRLGGIKVGSGLSIDGSTGVLSVSGGTDLSDYTTTATTAELSAATSGIAVDLETLSAYTAGINDTVYEYDAITAMTVDERKELFKELTASTLNGEKVWVHRQYNADDYWFLIDTVNSTLLKFSSKNDDSITNFTLGITGNYGQTKKYYCPKASASQLGGIKVGSGLSIDNRGVLSVSGGSQSGPTVIDFDAMTQQERADLFTVIYDKYTGTTDGINNEYTFYKTFNNWTPDNAKDRKFRVQFAIGDSSRLLFSYVTAHLDYGNYAHSWKVWLFTDGTMSTEDADIKGLTEDVLLVKTYFQGGHTDYTLTFNKATSAFTAENGGSSDPVTDDALDAVLYWAGFHNGDNVGGPTVIRLRFNLVDNGETTSYYFPSLSCKSITPTTIGDNTYDEEGTVNYGPFCVKFFMNGTPSFGNLRFVENY